MAALAPIIVFLAVYLPVAGLGFISDDFRWIRESELTGLADILRLFRTDNGFYRPLVALSFGINRLFAGINPHPYGLTNLGLVVLCAVLVAALCRRLGLGLGASCLGAAIWALNFHGINMAILWISGRTALILIASAIGAAIAVVARRPLIASVLVACALFSKEETIMLPFCLLAWMCVLGEHRTEAGRRRLIVFGVGAGVALAAYFWLRSHTGAMLPSTAPSFYQLTLQPALVFRNVAEYADRALSYPAAVALVAFLILGPGKAGLQLRATTAWLAATWYIGGFALTTLVPSRSSLYALFPSVAGAILAAEVCGGLWRRADRRHRTRALVAVIVIPFLCVPAYTARNRRWTDLARLSTGVLTYVSPYLGGLPDDVWVVFVDDQANRVNVASAFGALLPDALALRAGRAVRVWVDNPSSSHWTTAPAPCDGCPRRTFVIRGGTISVSNAPQ